MRGGLWYFVGPYDAKEAILAWRPERGKPEIIGGVAPRRRYRGLEGGRFISIASGDTELLMPRDVG
jgi:hypothetical protein